MSSTLIVDKIQTPDGVTYFENGERVLFNPGEIIETLYLPCDGRSVTVRSGTYYSQAVTAVQGITNAYVDLLGSVISYKPPAGTKTVVYRFNFSSYWETTAHSIQHFRFYIDGVEIPYARFNRSAQYYENKFNFEWPIKIGYSDTNSGAFETWDSIKTLKLQTRRYATSSHGQNMHGTTYWDGAGGNVFSLPTLSIIAIA